MHRTIEAEWKELEDVPGLAEAMHAARSDIALGEANEARERELAEACVEVTCREIQLDETHRRLESWVNEADKRRKCWPRETSPDLPASE
jgi:hypothetical protein